MAHGCIGSTISQSRHEEKKRGVLSASARRLDRAETLICSAAQRVPSRASLGERQRCPTPYCPCALEPESSRTQRNPPVSQTRAAGRRAGSTHDRRGLRPRGVDDGACTLVPQPQGPVKQRPLCFVHLLLLPCSRPTTSPSRPSLPVGGK